MSRVVRTKVYLVVEPIHRRGGGLSEHSRYRAKWIGRGTGTCFYTSKAADAARRLAEKWLASQNTRPSRMENILAAEEWAGPRFEDVGRLDGVDGSRITTTAPR